MESMSGENWPHVAKSRTPPNTGVAAARQLGRSNRKVTGGLSLMKPDSLSGGGGDLLPLPTAWTTEGPKPRIWKPNPSAESGIFTVLGRRERKIGNLIQDLYTYAHINMSADPTYSLGLVLTSTLRGPLLLKHCLRRTSTSEKGLRNTRSPFMANNFFPTSRPAILTQVITEEKRKE